MICTGTFSRRKGARVWAEAFDLLRSDRVVMRFVGHVHPDARAWAGPRPGQVEFVAKVPQGRLPAEYAWADLFALPTLEDGYPVVVPQALASGLPVISTTSNGASEAIVDGDTGWVIPPGRADLLADRIRWADAHRGEVIAAVRRLAGRAFDHDWAQTAADCVRIFRERSGVTADRPGGGR